MLPISFLVYSVNSICIAQDDQSSHQYLHRIDHLKEFARYLLVNIVVDPVTNLTIKQMGVLFVFCEINVHW